MWWSWSGLIFSPPMSTITNHWRWFLLVFCVTLLISVYSCWINGDAYESRHNYMGGYGPDAAFGVCVSVPGMLASFLVFDGTDIPERIPDSWQVAWLIAPVSAVFWTVFAIFAWKITAWIKRKITAPKSTPSLELP
jgi:hypothetical protein